MAQHLEDEGVNTYKALYDKLLETLDVAAYTAIQPERPKRELAMQREPQTA